MKTSAERTVRAALADRASIPVEDLSNEQDIFDLGLDSMDFWTILIEVEDLVGSPVPAEVLDRIALLDIRLTVGELLAAAADWDAARQK